MTISTNDNSTLKLMYIGQSSLAIATRYLTRLIALQDVGFEVHVLASDDGGFPILANHGICVRPLPLGNHANIAGWLGAYFIMQAYLLEQKPALVHLFDQPLAWLSAFAAKQAGCRVVVASVDEHIGFHHWVDHSIDSETITVKKHFYNIMHPVIELISEQPVERLFSHYYGWLAAHVDSYIVSNDHDSRLVRARNLVTQDKLDIVPGAWGIDSGIFDASCSDLLPLHEARAALGIPDKWKQVIGYAGSIQNDGELDMLHQCIRQLHRTHPYVVWLIRVPRVLSKQSRTKLMEFDDENIVYMHDDPEDISVFFRALDLFISFEQNGPELYTHLLQSSAMSVCPLTFQGSWSKAVVNDRQSGRLTDKAAPQAIVEAAKELLDDPARLYELGERARQHVVTVFDEKVINKRIFEIYDRLLEPHFR